MEKLTSIVSVRKHKINRVFAPSCNIEIYDWSLDVNMKISDVWLPDVITNLFYVWLPHMNINLSYVWILDVNMNLS